MFMGSVNNVKSRMKRPAVDNATASFIAGGLMGIAAIGCPCPVCIGSSAAFILNGLKEKFAK